MIKHIKKVLLGFALANTMFVNVAFANITATPEQEVGLADASLDNIGWVFFQHPSATQILEEVIENNEDKLRIYTNDNRRGIPGIYLTYQQVGNSYTTTGGRIIISTDFVNELLYNQAKGYSEKMGSGTYYQQSVLAAIVAHECSHWYRNDGIRRMNLLFNGTKYEKTVQNYINNGEYLSALRLEDKYIAELSPSDVEFYRKDSMEMEERADRDGMEFLARSTKFSVGGMASFLRKTRDDSDIADDDTNLHPQIASRYQQVLNYIANISNGRVVVKNDLLYLDGKKFMGTGKLPARRDITSYDRTMYVAGQLASAIRYGISKPTTDEEGGINCKSTDHEEIRKGFDDLACLSGWNEDDSRILVYDFIDTSQERLHGILEGRIQPANDEEQVAVEIKKFLHSNR